MKERMIRAAYDDDTITVYQAFNKEISQTALKEQTFVSPPFKKERMTWIKPSFLWMMYRSGWATKENQEYILSIKIKRQGFEWALQNSCLSHFDASVYISHEKWRVEIKNSPVRIQWDPEKNIFTNPLPYKSIQIGLTSTALEKYISDWIVEIKDITEHSKTIHRLVMEGEKTKAIDLLPIEKEYNLTNDLALKINAT